MGLGRGKGEVKFGRNRRFMARRIMTSQQRVQYRGLKGGLEGKIMKSAIH